MRQVLLFSFLSSVFFSACISHETNSESKDASSKALSKRPPQSIEDSTYRQFVIDTTQTFDSLSTLKAYKKDIDLKFKHLKDTQTQASSHTIDSLYYLNEDLYAYLLYKHLKRKEQSEKNITLLLYNFTFSNLISSQERLNVFNTFPEEVRKSKSGKFVSEKLNEKLSEGQSSNGVSISQLKPFQLVDSVGNKKHLAQWMESADNYTLIIFSASWCHPCRYEALLLKNELQHIDTSRLKFITISLDNDKEKWMKAIKKDACPWLQLWSPGELNSGIAKSLKITAIPANFLVNERQQIVAQHTNVNEILKKVPEISLQTSLRRDSL